MYKSTNLCSNTEDKLVKIGVRPYGNGTAKFMCNVPKKIKY